MRICIDARSPGYAGILNYTSCLLKSLTDIDTENDYLILTAPSDKKWNLSNAEVKVIPSDAALSWFVWSNTTLPLILEKEKIDVYHSLKHLTCFRGKSKKLITFHSARHFFQREYYKLHDYAYWRIMNPLAAKKYDSIIVVSEAEKSNFVKYTGVSEHKFKVINLAADSRFRVIHNESKLNEAKEKYNLPDKYILFVGRIHPVKNIETIINAFCIAKKSEHIEHKLVIVGMKTPYYDKIASLIKELQMEDDVVFTGAVYEELPYIYNLSELFVIPSHYESFGAVPLEAMACGTPVIASNSGGLPEVVGDAGILVSPDDVDAFADAIVQVLGSAQKREDMIVSGLKRVKMFSWERCARETINIYRELTS